MNQALSRTPAPDDNRDVESRILELARSEPELGQAAVAERLRLDGLQISASGVRYIWQKHGLETAVKRLQALADEAGDGVEVLTENQRRLLERGELSARLARGETANDSGGEPGGDSGGEPVERRQVILTAAAELFSEQGYDRSSIRDIARKVGLLPGSVYHYFPSKDELYLAVHREGFQRVLGRVKAAAEEGSDPWDRLRRACEVHVSGIVEGSPIDRITGHSLSFTGNQELLAKIQPYREAYEEVFRDLIKALPVAPGTDRTLLRLFLLGGMNWIYLWYREGRRSPRDIADAMVEMVRRGVTG
ncbi:TetR/AcrR family transcriptional regulator [Azoarcus olearius]|uniref:TetR family transcriptional regulator n=1 Tax=Azoarcus sp. (strain BH72) TaxID=418699 RepID=A1K8G6_AZOSB|nr:TetR/AcrR family transcriptional regulator [Azoarcus olearius]ANQ85687.1 TetR family transcriptional regulator [Azoarcus olearius]CAL95121.1 putative TetR family transcriptional regulator [Azoarcus olearius]